MTVVKKAISLKDEQDKKLQKIKKLTGVSYSKLLQEAVDLFLRQKDIMAMEEEYAAYYGDPKQANDGLILAREMWKLSQRSWLE